MKHIVSISISEETILKMKDKIRGNPSFRNKSHFIEYAIERCLDDSQ